MRTIKKNKKFYTGLTMASLGSEGVVESINPDKKQTKTVLCCNLEEYHSKDDERCRNGSDTKP